MKILVDADGCPVKEIIVKVAKRYKLEVVMIMDIAHEYRSSYCEVIQVDKHRDSVDFVLINKAKKGDIVVSQDYGVATMALSKGACAIGNSGLVYTDENIDNLLQKRHTSRKLRNSGVRVKGPSKRTKEDNERFESNFIALIESAIN